MKQCDKVKVHECFVAWPRLLWRILRRHCLFPSRLPLQSMQIGRRSVYFERLSLGACATFFSTSILVHVLPEASAIPLSAIFPVPLYFTKLTIGFIESASLSSLVETCAVTFQTSKYFHMWSSGVSVTTFWHKKSRKISLRASHKKAETISWAFGIADYMAASMNS